MLAFPHLAARAWRVLAGTGLAAILSAPLMAAPLIAPPFTAAAETPGSAVVCRRVVRCAPGGINRQPQRHCRSVRTCTTQDRYRRQLVTVRRCETIATGRDSRGSPTYGRVCRNRSEYRFVRVPTRNCHYKTVCGGARTRARNCQTHTICERRPLDRN